MAASVSARFTRSNVDVGFVAEAVEPREADALTIAMSRIECSTPIRDMKRPLWPGTPAANDASQLSTCR